MGKRKADDEAVDRPAGPASAIGGLEPGGFLEPEIEPVQPPFDRRAWPPSA